MWQRDHFCVFLLQRASIFSRQGKTTPSTLSMSKGIGSGSESEGLELKK